MQMTKNPEIKAQADICVIGGSCTGVFAAVRAARLGKKVILVEQSGKFGGVATLGLVNVWHSIYDLQGEKQIIGGLTYEILERLEKHQGVSDFRKKTPGRCSSFSFNSDELTLELDALVNAEKNIRVFFHTSYAAPVMAEDGKKASAVVLLNKDGLFAVKAQYFVDASGDGLLCRDAGVPMWTSDLPQPPTSCCHLEGWTKEMSCFLKRKIEANREKYPDLPCGYAWDTAFPNTEIRMLAGTRVLNCKCEKADDISAAEMTARRQIRAMIDMMRAEYPAQNIVLHGLPSAIGIREGSHITSIAQTYGDDILYEKIPVEETIGCGTYPVDIHHSNDDKIEFFELNGKYTLYRSDVRVKEDRWLPEGKYLPFYRIPMKALIPVNLENVIAAGRMLDADRKAFGALRVMVNLNQCGEAAGTAAAICIEKNIPVQEINTADVRRSLKQGGSILA